MVNEKLSDYHAVASNTTLGWPDIRSETWKSGLASEAITQVPRQLEQNGQVLRIPYNICLNLVYIRVLCVEN